MVAFTQFSSNIVNRLRLIHTPTFITAINEFKARQFFPKILVPNVHQIQTIISYLGLVIYFLTLYTFGVLVGQLKLLVKQLLNITTNIGYLTWKHLTTIPGSSMCLVFEEPHESFYSNNKKGELEMLGPLHPIRLKHVAKLHIIVESNDMGYIARHGGGAHYETTFGHVVDTLEMYPIPYLLYEKNTDYSTQFIYLKANPTSIKKWTNAIDWDFVKESLQGSGVCDLKRNQKQSQGYGFTSGMCMTAENTTNHVGVSEPRTRAMTFSSKTISSHFNILTEFGRNTNPEWLEGLPYRLWEDPDHPERNKNFASTLVCDGICDLESQYNASSNSKQPLGSHTDKSNPDRNKPSLSPVEVISRTGSDGNRYAVIGAMRKSICTSLATVNHEYSFVNCVVSYVNGIDIASRVYTSESIRKLDSVTYSGIDSLDGVSTSCHLDPQSFFQIYLFYIPLLTKHFRLSFGELVSLQTTFDVMAKTHYYFGALSEYMLSVDVKWIHNIIQYHRGYRIGYFFLKVMESMQKSVKSIPPVRFNDYKTFECPNYTLWRKSCEKNAKLF